MNKLLTILMMVSISTTAMAEWTLVQTGDSGNMYIDFDSMQKIGDLVTVVTLNDYNEPQQNCMTAETRNSRRCQLTIIPALWLKVT